MLTLAITHGYAQSTPTTLRYAGVPQHDQVRMTLAGDAKSDACGLTTSGTWDAADAGGTCAANQTVSYWHAGRPWTAPVYKVEVNPHNPGYMNPSLVAGACKALQTRVSRSHSISDASRIGTIRPLCDEQDQPERSPVCGPHGRSISDGALSMGATTGAGGATILSQHMLAGAQLYRLSDESLTRLSASAAGFYSADGDWLAANQPHSSHPYTLCIGEPTATACGSSLPTAGMHACLAKLEAAEDGPLAGAVLYKASVRHSPVADQEGTARHSHSSSATARAQLVDACTELGAVLSSQLSHDVELKPVCSSARDADSDCAGGWRSDVNFVRAQAQAHLSTADGYAAGTELGLPHWPHLVHGLVFYSTHSMALSKDVQTSTLCAEVPPAGDEACQVTQVGQTRCLGTQRDANGVPHYKIVVDTSAPGYVSRDAFEKACHRLGHAISTMNGGSAHPTILIPACNSRSTGSARCRSYSSLSQEFALGAHDSTEGLHPSMIWRASAYTAGTQQGMLANLAPGRRSPWLAEGETHLKFHASLCAEQVGEPCGAPHVDPSIECRYKVHSTTDPNITAYRVNINTLRPGHVTRESIYHACNKLSASLANHIGYHPRLRPLCARGDRCDPTTRILSSSQDAIACAAGERDKCAGLPPEAVLYGVYLSTSNWMGHALHGASGTPEGSLLNQAASSEGLSVESVFTDTLCVQAQEDRRVGNECEVQPDESGLRCWYSVESTMHGNFKAYRIGMAIEDPALANRSALVHACSAMSDAVMKQTGRNPNLKPSKRKRHLRPRCSPRPAVSVACTWCCLFCILPAESSAECCGVHMCCQFAIPQARRSDCAILLVPSSLTQRWTNVRASTHLRGVLACPMRPLHLALTYVSALKLNRD